MIKSCRATRNQLNPARLRAYAGCAVLLLASGGCRTPVPEGRSSIEMLEPIATPPPKSDAKGDVSATNIVINEIPPSIIGDLAKPVYPAAALAAHAGECIVFVTITIDPNGTVSEVRPSWQRLNIPGKFSEDFLEAVRAAVQRWKFEPARNVYWAKEGDGELRYMNAETVSAQTDVKFTFEASGSVR
jgi:hypothetical protein